MSALSNHYLRALPQAKRTVAAASIGASYTRIGTIFGAGILWLAVISTLDEDVEISYDGISDWMTIKAHGNFVFDIKTNLVAIPGFYGIYVKHLGAAPAVGNLGVSTIAVDG